MKPSALNKKRHWWILIILGCGLAGWLFVAERPGSGDKSSAAAAEGELNAKPKPVRSNMRMARVFSVPGPGPKGEFIYIYDKAIGADRFLLSKQDDGKALPDSDAPAGHDLWLQDASGEERKVDGSVYRARFSPDGTRIAYTTTECVLRVEDLEGQTLAEVAGAYEPNWTPDGQKVLFAQVPQGSDVHMPETAHLAVLDLATHETRLLTDGTADDSRPHVHPSGDWVLFTSGSRSGLASFWKVPLEGGEAAQVTNVGLEEVNERFIPTPYKRTLWSQDRRWFLYDFKNGDREETWGLEFDAEGNFKHASRVGEGLDPQWREDGKTFAYIRNTGDSQELVVASLPGNTP